MSQQKIVAWLESNQVTILHRFVEAAQKEENYPSFAGLKLMDLRAVMKREIQGLTSYIAGNEMQLEGVTQTHKEQAREITQSIPTEEQLSLLDERLEIMRELFEADLEMERYRSEFQRHMDNASRFYRISTRKIEFDRQLGSLAI